jgi:hypothetical protein
MVNSVPTPTARKSDSDSARFRKRKLYGTKLPLVVHASRDHKGMYNASPSFMPPITETGLPDKVVRCIGDKIELTVTIDLREHHDHGSKRY